MVPVSSSDLQNMRFIMLPLSIAEIALVNRFGMSRSPVCYAAAFALTRSMALRISIHTLRSVNTSTMLP